MTTHLEDQLREVLRDAPEPDWRALRAAIDATAAGKRRARMLRATASGAAAAAAVVAIAFGAANSSIFEGQRTNSAGSGTPTASASSGVPASTAFVPRVSSGPGAYRMPMVFPDVAPQGADAPAGMALVPRGGETRPFTGVGANVPCLATPKAATPQPWGGAGWFYLPQGTPDTGSTPYAAGLDVVGWPTTTAAAAMAQFVENSGACTFDSPFDTVPWPGRGGSEANQFIVNLPATSGGTRTIAVRRVGDVTVHGWVLESEVDAQAKARALVDAAADKLLASKALDAPEPVDIKSSYMSPDTETQFVLPALEPTGDSSGVPGLVLEPSRTLAVERTVPVLGAQSGDPAHPGSQSVSTRAAEYLLTSAQAPDGSEVRTMLVTSSFADGKKAFDEIVGDRGTARWLHVPVREAWSGHDDATSFLAVLPKQNVPSQIALRLEGNVIISVFAQGTTQEQARTIATKLADEAAKNLVSYGRGPDGRPGNGK